MTHNLLMAFHQEILSYTVDDAEGRFTYLSIKKTNYYNNFLLIKEIRINA